MKRAVLGGELVIRLAAPGMTALHRVGVAGLWMTLEALEDAAADLAQSIRAAGGDWERLSDGVVLRWSGAPAPFFRALLAASFRLDGNGLVHFPALGRPSDHPEQAVRLQGALLGTLLQHGNTRGAGEVTVLARAEEDDAAPLLRYRPLTWYAHQRAAVSDKGAPAPWTTDPRNLTTLAGWLLPGGVVRHVGLGASSKLSEPVERLLALLYAPIGAFFVELRAQTQGVRPQFSLVLPEVDDLGHYARARRRMQGEAARTALAAGGAQAALRIVGRLRMEEVRRDLRVGRCRVVDFGTVAWSEKQKTRVALFDVDPPAVRGLELFQTADALFAPRVMRTSEDERFWVVPQLPELIAQNAIHGRPWWAGFAAFVADDARRMAVMGGKGHLGERQAMVKLIEEPGTLTGAEETMVRACHEAWRNKLGALGGRANGSQGGPRLDFGTLAQKEFEKQRVTFAQCKDATTFRQAITDFWSRGGRNQPLQADWTAILPFLRDERWREGRDLALLALASYGRTPSAERGEPEQTNGQEEGKA